MPTLEQLKKTAQKELKKATSVHDVDDVWRLYLGRKGSLTQKLRALKEMAEVERKTQGQKLNELKDEIEELVRVRAAELQIQLSDALLERDRVDVTYRPNRSLRGAVHPLTRVQWEVEDIFAGMGFSVAEGPQIEDEYHNFEALNIPADHPARDLWDTFWLKPKNAGLLLRTHTSPVQIRYMAANKPPIRVIAPGRTFRYEATDASHHFQFYQVEGLMVDEHISVANFRAVINEFFSQLFGKQLTTRLRPGFFPFVEPGFEVDMSCVNCVGKGCSTCGHSGWLEMGGAGMVHPSVFEAAGYNPKDVTGFAFGMGLDRLALMKYHIDDVRLFQESDIRFLKQFR